MTKRRKKGGWVSLGLPREAAAGNVRSAELPPSHLAAAHGKPLGQGAAATGRRASSPSSSARRQAGREGGGKAALEAQPPTAAELAQLRKLVVSITTQREQERATAPAAATPLKSRL